MSTRQTLIARAVLVALSLAAPACSPTLQDGRFSCGPDVECPMGFVCRSDMLCYRGAGDGGPLVDAPTSPEAGVDAGTEAGSRDGGGVDAATDAAVGCGPQCIELMVLNADPYLSGTIDFTDTIGGHQRILIPTYGTTSAVMDLPNVPVGGVLTVNIPPTLTLTQDLPIPREGRYLLALGPSSLSSSAQMLEVSVDGLHTGGYVYVQLIDMTSDETSGLVARGAGRDAAHTVLPNPFDHDTISEPLPFLPGSTGALRIELDATPSTLIAALLDDQIPDTEGTYYIVIAGRTQAHLDTPEGIRFIPGIPSSTALRSGRLVRFFNGLGTTATVCDGSTRLVTLSSTELSQPSVPTTSSPWALTVRTGTDCSTGLSHDVAVGAAVGRTLVSIVGDVATTWDIASISEPMPTPGYYTIVLHNGLPDAADIEGTSVPSLGTASLTRSTPPVTIMATTAAGPKTFDWHPTAPQSWMVIGDYPAGIAALEIDSPFEGPWALTTVVSP